jgi:hypothetical protein
MIEKQHKKNGAVECVNHPQYLKLENMIQNKIFFVEKVKKTEKKPAENNKLYEDLELLKNFNQKFLNDVGFSIENNDTSVYTKYNEISHLNKNQIEIDFMRYLSELKNNFDTIINTIESNNILIQNTIRKIEMIFNGLSYC